MLEDYPEHVYKSTGGEGATEALPQSPTPDEEPEEPAATSFLKSTTSLSDSLNKSVRIDISIEEPTEEADSLQTPLPPTPDPPADENNQMPAEIVEAEKDQEDRAPAAIVEVDKDLAPTPEPLPDMEETIALSSRAQRIVLYMARRQARQKRRASQPDPSTRTLNTLEIEETSSEMSAPAAPVAQAPAQTDAAAQTSASAALTAQTAPSDRGAAEPTVQATPPVFPLQDRLNELAHMPTVQTAAITPITQNGISHDIPDPDSTAPALEALSTRPQIEAMPVLSPASLSPALPKQYRQPDPWFSRSRATTLRNPQHRKRIARLQYFSRKRLRRARANDRRASRSLWTKIWIALSTFSLIFLTIGAVVAYIAYNFYNTTQGTYASQVLTLRDLLPPDNLKIYDSQGTLMDQLTDQGAHTTVKYAQVASDLVNATISIEDRTFWQNSGVDITGILRAAMADLQNGQTIEGGSTITQQLVKKLLVGSSPDVLRKLSELILAPEVSRHYSKQDIMEMYLNTIYYGHQAYGIDAAATIYFGLEDKPGHSAASQLDLAQSILLAGLPRNASLYDPVAHPETSAKRFQEVMTAMIEQGYITQLQAQDAYQEAQSPTFYKTSPTLQDQAPHFDDYVLTQLEQTFHLQRSQISRSGLIVTTTLNLALQQQIQPMMQRDIAAIPKFQHITNAAEVLIDFHTGAIISMLGSLDYYNKAIDGQYNVALAYRQPGSSFKPYVYVTAFAQGASPAQAIDDTRTNFANPGGFPNPYSPNNYDLRFHGQMTLRCALQNSLNVPAVRVLQHVGVNNALQTAQEMGITTYQGTPGLSMVLGGLDIRLLDHTSAYGVFANGGVRQPYYSISKVVQGNTGKVLFQHTSTPGTRVITPQLAYMMTSVLSDNTSRLPEFFDCNPLQLYSNSVGDCYRGNRGPVRPAAAKTGTTQDFRDNWTMGYTTDYVMGVWAGNDDNSPMYSSTGVDGAAPIWHDGMLLAEQGHPISDFTNPGGLTRATATYPNGVTSTDWFLPGTVPSFQPTPTSTTTDTPVPGIDIAPPPGSPSPSAPYCGTYSFSFGPAAGGPPDNSVW